MMTPIMRLLKLCTTLLLPAMATCCPPLAAAGLETVVVTGRRVATSLDDSAVSIARIGDDALAITAPTHVSEIAWRAAGTWISRGSGQEHLTAIRSPVLTGPGSCGAFLFLEDGVPIRPAGFCNVNELFEINTAQAHAIEIARGPLSAVWGANALHGALNVVQRLPESGYVEGAYGPDDYIAMRAALPLPRAAALLANVSHDGGERADSGYDEAKLNLLLGAPGALRVHVAVTRLQQETAGFVVGTAAYRDDELRKTNPNPEAFRDADALRATVTWPSLHGFEARAYARHSRMSFLQHFLPGRPLERNGQDSAGLQLQRNFTIEGLAATAGLDLELATGSLEQRQSAPTEGSAFLRETRPAGRHYDYEVDSRMAALWVSATRPLAARITLELAARAEYLHYRYDNRLADGNLRDDGIACGFGGCLYNRPADRRDTFVDLAPRIGLVGRPDAQTAWRLQLARGFRPPQATELYRLQRGQDVAELDSERIDSLEAGIRLRRGAIDVDVAGFWMLKRDTILRDAEGFNVSAGRTRHAGLETDFQFAPSQRWRFALTLTLARHRYAFDRLAAFGEPIRDGNEIDTAPEALGSARVEFRPAASTHIEIEAVHLGSHYIDAANTASYPGHTLLHLRLQQRLGKRFSLGARIVNLGDRRYAERADFAFGSERYFPGRERSLYIDLRYRWPR